MAATTNPEASAKEKPIRFENCLVRAIDASTAHLTPKDMRLLDYVSNKKIASFPQTVSHEYGWMLFLPGDDKDSMKGIEDGIKEHNVGPGLSALIRHGARRDVYFLNLDADAGHVPGIPVYQGD